MRRFGRFTVIIVAAVAVHVDPVAFESLRFVTVSAGADHACALTDRGHAYCWGSNEFGQLGIGSADSGPYMKPERVTGDVTFTTIAAGLSHTCGLTKDSAVFCWGANDSAQLGDGTIKNSALPVRVSTGVRFKSVGPGGSHTCAVATDDVGYCWGGNWHGQLGVGDRDGDAAAPCCYRVPTPIRTDLRFRMVAAGGIHSCGVALDKKAYCWGSPQEGRLGTGAADAANKSADKTTPTPVVGEIAFETITRGSWHTCGLAANSAVFCWGGSAFQMDSPVPKRVGGEIEFANVATGLFHDCAVTRDGIAYCWGENKDGQLGDGTTTDATLPRRVATNRRFASISPSGNVVVVKPGDAITWAFTCALTKDDAVLCWGDNRHGALGNGSTTRALTPIPISDPTGSIR